MKKDINKGQNPSQKAHRTARWAKTMTKWLISKNKREGSKWQVVNFAGYGNSESRGIVDLLAIRKDHRKQSTKIKRGDLFEIVMIQVKGGSASMPTTEDVKRLKEVAAKIDARNLLRDFYVARSKAKLEDVRFHDLRHTFATRLVQSGVDLYAVKQLLGHKNITMTMRYAHHCPESLRYGVEVLDTFGHKMDTIVSKSEPSNFMFPIPVKPLQGAINA